MLLYDQFGRPIERLRKPERRPMAVAPILDSFRDYVTDGLTPERLASVFKEADAGDVRRQAELFEQLEEKDGHLLCERDKRRNVILSLDFQVTPASDDARDAKVAEFVGDFFTGLADWDDCLVSLQDAVGKGVSGLEIHWDVSSGQAQPEKLEFIEQKRLRYLDAAGVVRRYPLLLTDADGMGVEIPAWKAMLHQYGGKSGHPTRSGIYRVAAWMVLFKHYSIKDWLIFCEVFGMPLRVGRYDQGATDDDKRALLAAISSLGTDAAAIISKATEIELVRAEGSQSAAKIYEDLTSFTNGEISKALLGQTLSAEVGDKGSYAAAKTHEGVRLDLLQADGRALATTVRNQLIRPLVGFNFGWDTPTPGYQALFEEDDDLEAKSQWVERITKLVQVPAAWLREEFGIPEPGKGEDLVGGQAAPVPVAAKLVVAADRPGFTPEQAALEGLADRAVTEAGRAMAGNEALLAGVIEQAGSLEEAMERLVEAYPQLDLEGLRELLERSLMAAELHGRWVGQHGR